VPRSKGSSRPGKMPLSGRAQRPTDGSSRRYRPPALPSSAATRGRPLIDHGPAAQVRTHPGHRLRAALPDTQLCVQSLVNTSENPCQADIACRMSALPSPSVTATECRQCLDGAVTVSIPGTWADMEETLVDGTCQQPHFAVRDVRHSRRMTRDTRERVRFWESNGSGGTLSGAVRSGHNARMEAPDVQECGATAALPACALSSHRGGQGSCQLRLRQAKLTFKLSSLVLRACHAHGWSESRTSAGRATGAGGGAGGFGGRAG